MESEKVVVTLGTSKYHGRYGVIKKVTPKKFKIRLWNTGEETYLMQTSVQVLIDNGSDQGQKCHMGTEAPDGVKQAKAKVRSKVREVNQKVDELLELADADGITKDKWEDIVEQIRNLFI